MSTTTGDGASTTAGESEPLEGECSVRVYVRIRPLNKKELAEKQVIEWKYDKTRILEETQNGQRQYAYDACFGVDSSNALTYIEVGKPVVIKAMEGYNGTVFTYGQTGSGKTWTMRGNAADPGMMILCLDDIFNYEEKHPEKKFEFKVSYMEVYNEDINDLLYEVNPELSKEERDREDEKHKRLRITTEDATRGAVIENLIELAITSKPQALAVLERGEANRSYASTSMNDTSSRSHVIYRIAIIIFDREPANNQDADDESILYFRKDEEETGRVSYMNLVDLAGSERQKSTNTTGKTLKEGANINKSLLALGAVINKLGEASKRPRSQKNAVFIPYRDSKLTRILKQSLGGNTLTSILCTISPAPMFRDETVSTLKFGQLCKLIKNQVQSNIIHDEKAEMRRLRTIISEQKAKIEELDSRSGGVDNHAELTRAFRDKKRLEATVVALEVAFRARGGDPASIQISSIDEGGGDDDYAGSASSELASEYKRKIKLLESKLSEYKELDDERHDLEERKREIESDKEKLEVMQKKLAESRMENMKELDKSMEKEASAQKLLDKLSEMHSRLQMKLNELKDLEDRWKGSVSDLKKKEDLVKEWEQTHKQKEDQLEFDHAQLKSMYQEHSVRIAELAKEEQKHKAVSKELEDRRLKLEVTLSKIGQREDERVVAEERLQCQETDLKRREDNISLREWEIHSRKREHESWDSLLSEKDRNIAAKQREVDDKESKLLEKEDKLNEAKLQMEKKLSELRQNEKVMVEKTEAFTNRLRDLQTQEDTWSDKLTVLTERESELLAKLEKLKEREKQIDQLQVRMSGIDLREKELVERIEEQKRAEERHHAEIGQISAKHQKEIKELDTLINQQSKIIDNFKLDLERSKSELVAKSAKTQELELKLRQRDAKEEQLKEELKRLESLGNGLNSSSRSGEDPFFESRTPTTSAAGRSFDEVDSVRAIGYSNKSPLQPQSQTSKDLMRRLADSQRALFHILEANKASPHVSVAIWPSPLNTSVCLSLSVSVSDAFVWSAR